MKKIVWWAFVALFLISCSKEADKLIPSPSIIPVDSPVPTKTVFGKPLITPTISSTSRPVPTKTPTSTPDPILLTQEAEVSACAGSEKTALDKYVWDTYFTNGQWSAYVCKDNGVYTKILNTTDGIVWNIPAIEPDETSFEPRWYWLPNLWSDNGKYLYLKAFCFCIIEDPWGLYSSGYGLSRLDLDTGEFAVWLKPDSSGYSFEFTQDGNLFAFSPSILSHAVKIRDLMSGDEQSLSFKEKYVILEYRWTPNNSRLVIFTAEYENNPSENGYSVFVYNVENDVLKKLLDKNNLKFSFPAEDFTEPRIYISDLTSDILSLSDTYDENNFQLDLNSGELIHIDESVIPTATS